MRTTQDALDFTFDKKGSDDPDLRKDHSDKLRP